MMANKNLIILFHLIERRNFEFSIGTRQLILRRNRLLLSLVHQRSNPGSGNPPAKVDKASSKIQIHSLLDHFLHCQGLH